MTCAGSESQSPALPCGAPKRYGRVKNALNNAAESGVVGGEVEAEAGGEGEVEVAVGDFVAGLPEFVEERLVEEVEFEGVSVGDGGGEMGVGGECNGGAGTVEREGFLVGECEGVDFLEFGEAAADNGVGLEESDEWEEVLEVVEAVLDFGAGERLVGFVFDLLPAGEVVAVGGGFEEVEVEGFEGFGEGDGLGDVE